MGNLKTKGARFVVRKQIQRNFHFLSENKSVYCSCIGAMKLFMCEVLVSVKHFYVPNLEKSRDRFFVWFYFSNKGGGQDIQLTNDKRIVSHYSDPKSAGKVADPGT